MIIFLLICWLKGGVCKMTDDNYDWRKADLIGDSLDRKRRREEMRDMESGYGRFKDYRSPEQREKDKEELGE